MDYMYALGDIIDIATAHRLMCALSDITDIVAWSIWLTPTSKHDVLREAERLVEQLNLKPEARSL